MPRWRLNRAGQSQETVAAPSSASNPLEQRERVLLQGVMNGKQGDFESLYRIYHPRLQRFVGQLTRQPDLVDEILDDTMMVVWRRAQAFDGRSKLSTWIFGIAYRKTLKTLSRLDLPQEDSQGEEPIEPGPNPEEQLDAAQSSARLQLALRELSADHRAVVELCYFHGMAYGEIAQVVDCPPETVKTRMFYARRRLRLLLTDITDQSPGESS